MNTLLAIFSFVFGCLWGSFLNVVILRLPEEEKLTGRSHCIHCKHILAWWELVPILSFVFLGGRCHRCKKSISPRYFIIESITGLLFLASFLQLHPHNLLGILTLLKWWLVIAAALSIFVIDLEHYLILDVIVFPVLVAVLALNFGIDIVSHARLFSLASSLVSGIAAGIAGALPFFCLWYFSKGRYMGFGDVKLMLLLGAVVGLKLIGVTFLLAIFSGGLASAALLVWTKKTLTSRVPFGTFLSAALLVTLFFGQRLLDWYLSFLGF